MRWVMRHFGLAILLLTTFFLGAIVLVSGLGPEIAGEAEDILGYGGPHSDEVSGSRTLFHTGIPIGGRKRGESYGAFNARRDRSTETDYLDFGCVGSCRANAAGYRWAAAGRLTKPRQCVGPDWSFVEGCAAFVLPRK